MAHTVEVKIPKMQVSNNDFIFVIREEKELIGRLKISQGNLEWTPAGHSVRTYIVRWKDFNEFIKKRVTPSRKG